MTAFDNDRWEAERKARMERGDSAAIAPSMYTETVSRRYTGEMRYLADPDTMRPSKKLQQRVEIVTMSSNGLIPSQIRSEWEDVPTVAYWDAYSIDDVRAAQP